MAGIPPLLSRRHHEDGATHHLPKVARTQSCDPVTLRQTAPDSPLLDHEGNRFDGLVQVHVIVCCLVLLPPSGRFLRFLILLRASRAHLLLLLPDASLHETLNQRRSPRVAGHELFQSMRHQFTGTDDKGRGAGMSNIFWQSTSQGDILNSRQNYNKDRAKTL